MSFKRVFKTKREKKFVLLTSFRILLKGVKGRQILQVI